MDAEKERLRAENRQLHAQVTELEARLAEFEARDREREITLQTLREKVCATGGVAGESPS